MAERKEGFINRVIDYLMKRPAQPTAAHCFLLFHFWFLPLREVFFSSKTSKSNAKLDLRLGSFQYSSSSLRNQLTNRCLSFILNITHFPPSLLLNISFVCKGHIWKNSLRVFLPSSPGNSFQPNIKSFS